MDTFLIVVFVLLACVVVAGLAAPFVVKPMLVKKKQATEITAAQKRATDAEAKLNKAYTDMISRDELSDDFSNRLELELFDLPDSEADKYREQHRRILEDFGQANSKKLKREQEIQPVSTELSAREYDVIATSHNTLAGEINAVIAKLNQFTSELGQQNEHISDDYQRERKSQIHSELGKSKKVLDELTAITATSYVDRLNALKTRLDNLVIPADDKWAAYAELSSISADQRKLAFEIQNLGTTHQQLDEAFSDHLPAKLATARKLVNAKVVANKTEREGLLQDLTAIEGDISTYASETARHDIDLLSKRKEEIAKSLDDIIGNLRSRKPSSRSSNDVGPANTHF